jgi:hypothetical protein
MKEIVLVTLATDPKTGTRQRDFFGNPLGQRHCDYPNDGRCNDGGSSPPAPKHVWTLAGSRSVIAPD